MPHRCTEQNHPHRQRVPFGAKLVEKVGEHGLALDALTVATTSPAGIDNGKWPQSASTDFDAQTPDKDKWDPR
ncbi:hypothetical protein [Nocardia brasiliensis]|uniref:hypothetical protein n=1 Tax=Nocardia brasiliensis TaxID=37326 RepID=UPI002458BFE1|nr:hypothetical protein [Nocardia brasiliensis]